MADLTLAECAREGYDLAAHCVRCRVLKRLDRDRLIAAVGAETTVQTVWSRGLRCADCGSAAASLTVAVDAPSYKQVLVLGLGA